MNLVKLVPGARQSPVSLRLKIRFVCRGAETARDEQEQGDHRVRPQTIERHQHRDDQVAAAEIDQDRHLEDGRDHYEPGGYRGKKTIVLLTVHPYYTSNILHIILPSTIENIVNHRYTYSSIFH